MSAVNWNNDMTTIHIVCKYCDFIGYGYGIINIRQIRAADEAPVKILSVSCPRCGNINKFLRDNL